MAQIQNPRRFYIDRADDQPVVRAIPVRVPEARSESPATHQVTEPSDQVMASRSRTRLTPQRVTKLVRSARHRSRHPRS
jgi:hypothetical protein